MVDIATPKWRFLVEYIDKDGVIQTAEGMVPGTQETALKYVTKKYRSKSANGFFQRVEVTELAPGQTVKPTHSALTNTPAIPSCIAAKPQAQKPDTDTETKETFDKKTCFIYRYMGPIITNDSKAHEFYKVIPHI